MGRIRQMDEHLATLIAAGEVVAGPVSVVRELVDNALDACETAGIAPEIVVTVEQDAVSVRDNGPGLPERTLARSLDYLVRVSDKAHYVSPTRGQLGNALKCLWAAPYVADGETGDIEVPEDLEDRVRAAIADTDRPWDAAVWDVARGDCEELAS